MNSKQLTRIVILAGVVLVLLVASFGGYYYFDRYKYTGEDLSPIGKSIDELEQAIRTDPQNPSLRAALAESYLLNKQYDKAVEQAGQVLAAEPENDRALLTLGISSYFLNDPAAALEPLNSFIAIHEKATTANVDSSLETALYYQADCYLQLGQPQEAIVALNRALEINKTDSDAMYKLGRAYGQTGEHEKAITAYERAVLFVPNFSEAYQGMAESYQALNQPERANYAQGMVSYCAKDYPAAVTELEKVVAALPDFVPARLGLGLAYEGANNLTAARETMVKTLELDPANFAAQQALGRIDAALGK